jgi:hypothetical protein
MTRSRKDDKVTGRLRLRPSQAAGASNLDFATQKALETVGDADLVTAIVKVRGDDYVPDGCEVRSRTGDILTVRTSGARLRRLEGDPRVVSVSLAQRLPSIE